MKQLRFLENPEAEELGDSPEEFLNLLGQPSCIFLEGTDSKRTRAFVTLLHGNEPSGTRALHRWLKSGRKPVVNIICFLPSVEAALRLPRFSHRMLPGARDLNRCFRPPFTDMQGQLAAEVLAILQQYGPECVVDMHNTSGSGPGFGVAISIDAKHRALVSLFTNTLVTNDLRLGALMEISEHLFPTVTVECGGRLNDEAHELAWQGLQRFMTIENIFSDKFENPLLEVFHNPVRLELTGNPSLVYADQAQPDYDLTLKSDIERFNFGSIKQGTMLGWVGDKGLTIFSARNQQDECVLLRLLKCDKGRLLLAQDLKLFMVTSNPEIAKVDCLFYAASDKGDAVVAAY